MNYFADDGALTRYLRSNQSRPSPMDSSFHLSEYEASRELFRLDGKKLALPYKPGQTCLAHYSTTVGRKVTRRLVRVTRNESQRRWDVSNTDLGTFYLAGPMRGIPMFNFPAFLMAASILRSRGFEILSPADKDLEAGFDPSQPVEGQNFDIGAAFRWDFEAVCRSRGTILLPGWERSTGAKAERVVAQLCEREVYLLDANFVLTEAPEATYELTWTEKPEPVQPARKIEDLPAAP